MGRRNQKQGPIKNIATCSAALAPVKMPKLRKKTFKTAIIERYQRRESSVEEALIEMYLIRRAAFCFL